MTTLRTDSTHSGINIEYANGSGFVHGGSGPLTVYSDDEKNAIKALQNADNGTCYLFVVDNVTRLNPDGTAMKDILAGYMPIGYQCGFLFGSPAAKYVAHELGHGAFGLHHTFSSETESFSAPQYSTNNLMDYADGATLNYKQWTWMHEKHGAGVFGFLADEEESEMTNSNAIVTEILKTIHDANTEDNNECTIKKYGVENVFLTNSYSLGNKKIDIHITKQNADSYKINSTRGSCTINKGAQTEAFGKKGSYTTLSFYNNDYDNAIKILVADEYADELAVWLFGKDPIANALSVIETYIGEPYHNDSGQLRTGLDEAALAQMDCSELVCRFLQLACGLDNVPNLTTADFELLADGGNEYLQYIAGSDQNTYTDIKPGDVFLWRKDGGPGHVGVVKEYSNDVVTIIESIGSSGSAEEKTYNSNSCKGCIRLSQYTRTGNALIGHEGWQGYFRPIINTK